MFLSELRIGICDELGLSDETFVKEVCKDIYKIVGTDDLIVMGENPSVKKGCLRTKERYITACKKTSKEFNIPLNICMIIGNNQEIAEFISNVKTHDKLSKAGLKKLLGTDVCEVIGIDSFKKRDIDILSKYLTT